MPTDVVSTYSSLQAELNQAKGGLHKLDENLKKIIQTSGRYKQDRVANQQNSPNVFPNKQRFNEDNNNSFNNNSFNNTSFNNNSFNNSSFNNNSFNNNNNNRKRPHETKTVFSRLSRKVGDSEGEEETNEQNIRTRISSQVTRTLPTKQEVLRAQLNSDPGIKKDNAEVCRARRVFGSLLGTLRAFCKEEALARDKEVFARRVSLEQRIECKASVEAAELVNQRRDMIQQREQQIQKIKALEFQMHRVQSHEVWETSQKQLSGFIKTSAKSPIYWSPAKHTDKTKHLLASSQHQLRKTIDKRRHDLEADLEAISSKRLMKDKPKENEESIQFDKTNKDTEEVTDIVTEVVTEKVADKVANKRAEKVTDKVNNKITERVTNKATERVTNKVTEKVTNKIAEKSTEKVTNKKTEKLTDKVTDKVTDKITDKVTNKITDKITDEVNDNIADEVSEKSFESRNGSEAAEEEPVKMEVERSEEEVKTDEVEMDTKEENQEDHPKEETEQIEPAEQKDENQEPE